jgi:predicted oxidoreductase
LAPLPRRALGAGLAGLVAARELALAGRRVIVVEQEPPDARRALGERLFHTAAPHRILDPDAGPLIAVRLSILTRKTLGGLQTDLAGRVLEPGGAPVGGLYAAGEVAGFGGGGLHGYRSLEGTFLGGCLFSGRQARRAVAAAVG